MKEMSIARFKRRSLRGIGVSFQIPHLFIIVIIIIIIITITRERETEKLPVHPSLGRQAIDGEFDVWLGLVEDVVVFKACLQYNTVCHALERTLSRVGK